MGEADQKKLFSPYMQILPGELQKGAGTGLGLSISQNLIRIHGGQIGYAVPDDGRGSEFYMEVPMEMMYRQPTNSGPLGHSSTPNTSLRLVEGSEGKDGSALTAGGSIDDGADGGAGASGAAQSDLDDDSDEAVIGALPATEDRQEEDAFIKEIADLQLQQHSRARLSNLEDNSAAHSALEAPLSSSSSSASFSSSGSSMANSVASTSSANPLYVSRPALASPDSSMRVLAQQRMHAQHLRQSAPSTIAGATPLSPSLHHSSRRLLALARQPTAPQSIDGGTTPSSIHGEDSVVSSGAASVSSRSVSLVMNDAHGPAASPLLYKRSPITLTRRVGLATGSSSSPVSAVAGTTGSPLTPTALSLPAAADELADVAGGHVASDEHAAASFHSPAALHNSGVHPSLLSSHTQRRAIGGQSDGMSPATVPSNSTSLLPSVVSTPPSAGSSTGSSGSPNHGLPVCSLRRVHHLGHIRSGHQIAATGQCRQRYQQQSERCVVSTGGRRSSSTRSATTTLSTATPLTARCQPQRRWTEWQQQSHQYCQYHHCSGQ